MQSVFKFPIGVALLDCVSRGEFALSDSVTLTKADLSPDLWSPIRERWPEGVRLPLVSVMTYMVAHSDNSATDFLIHKIGGVARIQDIINRLGAKKSISATPKQRFKARGRCSSIIGLHPMRWLIFLD
jgi:Beta-lactamase class A